MSEITENELKELIQKFMYRWDNTNSLKWKDLLPNGKSKYKGYTLKISFGEGRRIQPPKCPWITFLKFGQTTSKGVYPIITYKCEGNSLDTFIGESYNHEPSISQYVLTKVRKVKHTVSSSIDKIIEALNHNIVIFDEIMKESETIKEKKKTKNSYKMNKKKFLIRFIMVLQELGKPTIQLAKLLK